MMEDEFEPTGRIETAVLQGLVNATTPPAPPDPQRITAEMPVLELTPGEAVAPPVRLDLAAAVFSITYSLVILAWFFGHLS